MKRRFAIFSILWISCWTSAVLAQEAGSGDVLINELEYFEKPGLNVMLFHDFYPEGHQGGVAFIQHGVRTATNGDLRLEPTPGQWQPLPKMGDRVVDTKKNEIYVNLSFPDTSKHLKGFNPIVYPDLEMDYTVRVTSEGSAFRVTVDLKEPLPAEWVGKVGFNLELFPTDLFGKSYYMDGRSGLFPRQVNGPMYKDYRGEFQAEPMAVGKKLTVAPEMPEQLLQIESFREELKLIDGRGNHNNGWYVVRADVSAGATTKAIDWLITPHVIPNWLYEPVVHVSQVGYHPNQDKKAIIELDKNDGSSHKAILKKLSASGGYEEVKSVSPEKWGKFLRYNYVILDFSEVKDPGLYQVSYGESKSNVFKIDSDVYKRHVWQPTLEYFLPVQMCHMRVNEKYKVWHGLCHDDDALMAPTDINHFDGYVQGSSTLTKYKPLEHVPGLNVGGWHDAGDYDLRVESQAGTVHILSLAYEEFGSDYDQTYIDQENKLVEMLHPDGKPDMLQQVEHGLLTILGGYENLGRLYRGIICPSLRQYVMLGDGSTMTDNVVYQAKGNEADFDGMWSMKVANEFSKMYDPLSHKDSIKLVADKLDDRMVFTEENPSRTLDVIGGLAAASRVMKEYNPDLSQRSLKAAEELWGIYHELEGKRLTNNKIKALAELILTTEKDEYKKEMLAMKAEIVQNIGNVGWVMGRVMPHIDDEAFQEEINEAVVGLKAEIDKQAGETPFGVPYRPHIWGAGWGIQSFGYRQYFLHTGWPETFSREYMLSALNFVLGCHPGKNTQSFASGVGAESLLVAYGVNRGEWSYIPGGVGSGTALIRPDFPELKVWPFLWQQTEYVMGGGGTNFMFLALASDYLLSNE
ncbi:glycoside hydrolase family 9 protein [Flammeovirgaceae bacterium SG7u.111]|nr:glycoside hydrolase family 9 protein [Flammeovirgaceae bacterium SG7u.111]